MSHHRTILLLSLLTAAAASCSGCDDDPSAAGRSSSPSASPSSSAGATAPDGPAALPVYEGSAVARDLASRYLVVADEDHQALRVTPLPLKADGEPKTLPLPGPPAQLVMRDRELLVTVRQPSLLIAFDTGGEDGPTDPAKWKERWRSALPDDAWGLALGPKQDTAYVSSAWAHQISAVSLADGAKRWSVDVPREPRGLLARDGELYVNHLIGTAITRLSDVGGRAPKVHRHELPPAPLRTPAGVEPAASLGYALAASPDGRRLFVPRHAIGALGEWAWYGAGTIDVWLTRAHKPVVEVPRTRRAYFASDYPDSTGEHANQLDRYGAYGSHSEPAFVAPGGPTSTAGIEARNPRHVVYRKSTDTLLVAHEGSNDLIEYDALAPAPSATPMRRYDLDYEQWPVFEYPTRAGAPSGIALSEDETVAWVYCRSTDDLVQTKLIVEPFDPRAPAVVESPEDNKAKEKAAKEAARKAAEEAQAKRDGKEPDAGAGGGETDDEKTKKKDGPVIVRLVDETAHADPDDPNVAVLQMGRAAYFQASSARIGEGVACATCHPDGRDDGYVWRELTMQDDEGNEMRRLFANSTVLLARNAVRFGWGGEPGPELPDTLGGARQTPMLAGRVAARGPYGWRGEAETLPDRIGEGLALHRSHFMPAHEYKSGQLPYFAAAIAKYLREGLRPPARPERELSAAEKRGQELFMDARVGCAGCHNPETHLSDGAVYPRIVTPRRGYLDEKNVNFKTPSLAFVSGTPPYFHDGSRSTLESVIDDNMDRMGKTTQLSDEERAALVAFVRTL